MNETKDGLECQDRPDDELVADAEARDPFWYCEVCRAQNHRTDGECQYCEAES